MKKHIINVATFTLQPGLANTKAKKHINPDCGADYRGKLRIAYTFGKNPTVISYMEATCLLSLALACRDKRRTELMVKMCLASFLTARTTVAAVARCCIGSLTII